MKYRRALATMVRIRVAMKISNRQPGSLPGIASGIGLTQRYRGCVKTPEAAITSVVPGSTLKALANLSPGLRQPWAGISERSCTLSFTQSLPHDGTDFMTLRSPIPPDPKNSRAHHQSYTGSQS